MGEIPDRSERLRKKRPPKLHSVPGRKSALHCSTSLRTRYSKWTAITRPFARASDCNLCVCLLEPYQGFSTMTCNPALMAAWTIKHTWEPGDTQSHAICARLACIAFATRSRQSDSFSA